MKLFAVGVSHKTAPVEVRVQVAVQRNEIVDLAHYLKGLSLQAGLGHPVIRLK